MGESDAWWKRRMKRFPPSYRPLHPRTIVKTSSWLFFMFVHEIIGLFLCSSRSTHRPPQHRFSLAHSHPLASPEARQAEEEELATPNHLRCFCLHFVRSSLLRTRKTSALALRKRTNLRNTTALRRRRGCLPSKHRMLKAKILILKVFKRGLCWWCVTSGDEKAGGGGKLMSDQLESCGEEVR